MRLFEINFQYKLKPILSTYLGFVTSWLFVYLLWTILYRSLHVGSLLGGKPSK